MANLEEYAQKHQFDRTPEHLGDEGGPAKENLCDITRLPPEMVRKGRFDEIFFVDLPSPQNCRDIFTIHLTKRSLDPAGFDLAALTAATAGFSGSEIEQAIVSAMYTAHAQGRRVSQEDLLSEIRQTKPLSVLMAENVTELREWAADRTVPCD